MKTVWITSLAKNQPRVAAVSEYLKRYGLQSKGHFWTDEPEKMAWRVALDSLLEARADVWLVLADAEEIAKPGVRYGLALLAASLREARNHGFPVMLMWAGGAPAVDSLPPVLQNATQLEEASPAWAAKIVAKANVAAKATAPDYRFNVTGDDRLGQWFEVGPRAGAWDGMVFGVSGGEAEINFQAVGSKGALPEKTVLEYAQQGFKLQVGDAEYTAWAVRNQVDADSSYYARVKGCPDSVLFMPYADDGESEATVIRLI